jgi:ribosomal protein S18 acetylase RimI-like enzyme
MTASELWLGPPSQDEFEQWLPRQEAAYAREIAESGAMPAAAAAEKARLDTARRFSSGPGSPGQLLFRLMAGDQPVGWLWLNVPVIGGDPLMAWVNDIEVDPGYRGRGYGRAAMLLAEREARARGMTSLGLNVHGQNTAARSLYDSLGYQVMTQQMRKPLLRGTRPEPRWFRRALRRGYRGVPWRHSPSTPTGCGGAKPRCAGCSRTAPRRASPRPSRTGSRWCPASLT